MEVIGVINLMDKHTIIRLKLEGDSNREVAQKLGINRKTVAKYWNDYKKLQKNLDEGKVDARIVQEKIAQEPKIFNPSSK
ncbi:helix-turn-helix domain-containing protein [Globicatella sanguinis]